MDNLFTILGFANHIGKSNQWVRFKIKKAKKKGTSRILFHKGDEPVVVEILQVDEKTLLRII